MTHTKEPWKFAYNPGVELTGQAARIAELEECEPYDLATIVIRQDGHDSPHKSHLQLSQVFDDRTADVEQHIANGQRIVTCVNALAGIPSEQIERDAKLYPHVREMHEELRRLLWAIREYEKQHGHAVAYLATAKQLLDKLGDDQ